MTKQELIERGFTTDRFNRVLDEWGNEYRNENGEVQFLEIKDSQELKDCYISD